jgi:hypothetical protein
LRFTRYLRLSGRLAAMVVSVRVGSRVRSCSVGFLAPLAVVSDSSTTMVYPFAELRDKVGARRALSAATTAATR